MEHHVRSFLRPTHTKNRPIFSKILPENLLVEKSVRHLRHTRIRPLCAVHRADSEDSRISIIGPSLQTKRMCFIIPLFILPIKF